jgi:DNA-binding response OmpR family regulator
VIAFVKTVTPIPTRWSRLPCEEICSPHLRLEESKVLNGLFGKKEKAVPLSIMHVDDDSALARYVVKLLEEHGYLVHTAGSGEEALKLLDQISMPNVLIVDFKLPDINGKQFVEHVRVRFGRTNVPPVLLLTAAHDGEATANRLQVDDYLPKPFDSEDLLEHIASLLNRTTQ